MVIEILFIMTMFLYFLSILPVPQVAPFGWAGNWLAFIAILLLGLYIFMPGIRG
jgi:hypothetical protein